MNQGCLRRDYGCVPNFLDVRRSNEPVTCIHPTLKGSRCSWTSLEFGETRGEPIRRRILGLVGIVDPDPIDARPGSEASNSTRNRLETSHIDVQELLRQYAKGCCCGRYGHRDKINEPGILASIGLRWAGELDVVLRSQELRSELIGTTPSPVNQRPEVVAIQPSTGPEVEQPEPISHVHESTPTTPLARPTALSGHHTAEASAPSTTARSEPRDGTEGYPWGLWTHTPTLSIDNPALGNCYLNAGPPQITSIPKC